MNNHDKDIEDFINDKIKEKQSAEFLNEEMATNYNNFISSKGVKSFSYGLNALIKNISTTINFSNIRL